MKRFLAFTSLAILVFLIVVSNSFGRLRLRLWKTLEEGKSWNFSHKHTWKQMQWRKKLGTHYWPCSWNSLWDDSHPWYITCCWGLLLEYLLLGCLLLGCLLLKYLLLESLLLRRMLDSCSHHKHILVQSTTCPLPISHD